MTVQAAIRILVVDDDSDLAAELVSALSSMGARAACVTSLAQAQAELARQSHDLLLIDLQLSQGDAMELIKALADLGQRPALALMSGMYWDLLQACADAARREGFKVVATLAKPLRRADLQGLMRNGVTATEARPQAEGIEVHDFMTALETGALTAYLQPQYRLSDGSLKGYELLSHWRLDNRDQLILNASHFLQLIRDPATHWPLLRFMFEQALATFRRAAELAGPQDFSLGINTPVSILAHPDFPCSLSDDCRAAGVDPGRIILELTSHSAELASAVRMGMTRARLAGFGLALDGFGSGPGTLEQLVREPFTEIKVDRFFLRHAMRSSQGQYLLSDIAHLCAHAGLTSTIGGIETAEMLDLACRAGFDIGQGFLLGTPMTAEQALKAAPNIAHRSDQIDWALCTETNGRAPLSSEEIDFLDQVFAEEDLLAAEPASAGAEPPDQSRPVDCLIIEDNAALRDEIAHAFTRNGQTCWTAGSLAEARQHLADRERLDVLILDLSLPDGNGLELLKEQRFQSQALHRNTIILTAHATQKIENNIRMLGIEHIVRKPASFLDLQARCTQILNHPDHRADWPSAHGRPTIPPGLQEI